MTTVRKRSGKRKPAPEAKPATVEPATPEPAEDPRDVALGGRELFDVIVKQMEWHCDQIEMQLRDLRRHDADHKSVISSLSETAGDGLAICAYARALYEAADVAR
jgi:hypothetical protein